MQTKTKKKTKAKKFDGYCPWNSERGYDIYRIGKIKKFCKQAIEDRFYYVGDWQIKKVKLIEVK